MELIYLLVMMSERCEERRRQIAGEDRAHCRERVRVVKERHLRRFQLPGCSSLVKGCALLLLLMWTPLACWTDLTLPMRKKNVQKKEDEMQGPADVIGKNNQSFQRRTTNKPKTYRANAIPPHAHVQVCTHHFARLLLRMPAYHPSRINASETKAVPLAVGSTYHTAP